MNVPKPMTKKKNQLDNAKLLPQRVHVALERPVKMKKCANATSHLSQNNVAHTSVQRVTNAKRQRMNTICAKTTQPNQLPPTNNNSVVAPPSPVRPANYQVSMADHARDTHKPKLSKNQLVVASPSLVRPANYQVSMADHARDTHKQYQVSMVDHAIDSHNQLVVASPSPVRPANYQVSMADHARNINQSKKVKKVNSKKVKSKKMTIVPSGTTKSLSKNKNDKRKYRSVSFWNN
jgi:hypothetical protein